MNTTSKNKRNLTVFLAIICFMLILMNLSAPVYAAVPSGRAADLNVTVTNNNNGTYTVSVVVYRSAWFTGATTFALGLADSVDWDNGAVWGYCTNPQQEGTQRRLGKPNGYVEYYYCDHSRLDSELPPFFDNNGVVTKSFIVPANEVKPYVVLKFTPANSYAYVGGASPTVGNVCAQSGNISNLFTPNYNIVFNGNGVTSGSTSSMLNLVYGTTYTLNANGFVKTGYRFAGWGKNRTTGVDYNNQQQISNLSSTGGTVNLYAIWNANTYTINYNGNGSTSGSTTSSGHTYNTSKNLTKNGFKKDGYDFIGWSKNASATTATYTDQESVKNLTSTHGDTITLYAVWKPHVYTVTLDGDGATNDATASVNPTYSKDMPNITTPPRKFYTISYDSNKGTCKTESSYAEYVFKGYFTGKNGTGTQYYDAEGKGLKKWDKTADTTLYAAWDSVSIVLPENIERNYTVHFNTEDDTMVISGETNSIVECTFDGWYTAKNGGTKVNSPYTPTKNIKLYAHWIDNGTIFPKLQKKDSSFVGWFTKPQSLETLTDCLYKGGGVDSTVKIPSNDSEYVYGGGGTDWDYSNKISFDLADKNILELYPWFNQFPVYNDTLSKYDNITEENENTYDIIAYENQNITYDQLLGFVNVQDYEDDYCQSLENLEESIKEQSNAENLKLKIVSIEYMNDGGYDDGVGSYVIENPIKLDTDKINIGNFIITYEVTDDGIVQYPGLHDNVTLTITKKGYILYNNNPSIVPISRFIIASDENINADNIENYLIKGHIIKDIEDDMNVVPWWISNTYNELNETEKKDYDTYNNLKNTKENNTFTIENSKQKLMDTIFITNISDLTFNPEYDLKNPDVTKEWKKFSDIKELFEYRETHKEEFENVLSFKIHIKVIDQFGKTNDSINTTAEIFVINDETDIDMLESNVRSSIRYINELSSSDVIENSESVWNSEYYRNILRETFDNYNNKKNLDSVKSKGECKKNINGKDISIPIIINNY